jgi:hypothetical protein
MDFFYSIWNEKIKAFQKPVWLEEVSSEGEDMHFEPLKGLLWTNRSGGIGKHDIWIASFNEKDNKWENPTCLAYPINTKHKEGMPTITHDYGEMFFHSDRPTGAGGYDIFVAKR